MAFFLLRKGLNPFSTVRANFLYNEYGFPHWPFRKTSNTTVGSDIISALLLLTAISLND